MYGILTILVESEESSQVDISEWRKWVEGSSEGTGC